MSMICIEYVHDPLGRRIAKKVHGTITEKYLWQGGHQLFHGSLAKGTSHLIIGAHHQFIEFMAAVIAVVFIKGHSGYPPYLRLFKQ